MESLKKYKIQLLAFLPFLLTSIFSQGFYHPDEHYQILELLNLKISNYADMSIFNWDYNDKIRPWFQTFLYFVISKLVFLKNPFFLAFIFRLFNSILGFLSIHFLSRHLFKEKAWCKTLLISWIWFVPFIFARTSSESLSISFFILGSVFLFNNKSFYAGFLLGAAFLTRFQMGIPISIGLLYFLFKEKNVKLVLIASLSLIISIGLGIIIDYWGYGEWVYTAYNYFYTNIIESRASAFGRDPFWFYLYKPIVKGAPPLSLFLILGTLVFWIKNKLNYWTLTTFTFLLVHCFIPHKELRFLNYIYILSPFFLFQTNGYFKQESIFVKWGFRFAVVINIIFCFKVFFTSAHSPVKFYKYIYAKSAVSYHVTEENEFQFTLPFYQGRKLETLGINFNAEISKKQIISTKYSDYLLLKKKANCEIVYSLYPLWVLDFNYFNWLTRSSIWFLWKCN